MVFDLTIDGVAKQLKAGTLHIKETANRRATASFRLDSLDRSYRPAEGDEVIIEEDSVRKFGGLIDSPKERGFGGPLHPGISTTINAVDFHVYAERRFVNETLAAGTLKSQLTTLVANYLDAYGVTLDAGQVNGPAMPELTYEYKRFDVVMNELMTLTASSGQPFIWEISYTKVLSAYQPSTEPAPFDLVGNDLPEVVGDIAVETSRSDQYANRVILRVAPKTEYGHVFELIGDGVTDTYDLDYTLLPPFLTGAIHRFEPGGVIPSGGETIAITGTDTPTQWEINAAGTQITRVAGPTENLYVYRLTYNGVFSGSWIAEDAAEIAAIGIWERVITIESVPNDATGQAFADAELAKRIEPITTVRYTTWEQGLEIGQQQEINVSARNVNGDAVIVDIDSRDLVHRIERSITAVIDATQTNIGRSFQDDYEIWYGDKGGGAGTIQVGSGEVSGGAPAPPFNSVQFNNGGAFGGSADFTYELNGADDALNVGPNNTVATNASHIYTFGTGLDIQ